MIPIRIAVSMVLVSGAAVLPFAAVADVAADQQTNVLRERSAVTQISVGRVTASAGTTVSVPVSVRDGFGSPLGLEKALGADVQSVAFRIRVLPSEAVVAVRVERAGVGARALPRFEIAPRTEDGIAYLAVFDTNAGPLVLPPRKTSTIAMLHLSLAPKLTPGTRIELRLDPAATVLANAAGTADESVANGWVELHDGLITVR